MRRLTKVKNLDEKRIYDLLKEMENLKWRTHWATLACIEAFATEEADSVRLTGIPELKKVIKLARDAQDWSYYRNSGTREMFDAMLKKLRKQLRFEKEFDTECAEANAKASEEVN
jgi:hypothetical protein